MLQIKMSWGKYHVVGNDLCANFKASKKNKLKKNNTKKLPQHSSGILLHVKQNMEIITLI